MINKTKRKKRMIRRTKRKRNNGEREEGSKVKVSRRISLKSK